MRLSAGEPRKNGVTNAPHAQKKAHTLSTFTFFLRLQTRFQSIVGPRKLYGLREFGLYIFKILGQASFSLGYRKFGPEI